MKQIIAALIMAWSMVLVVSHTADAAGQKKFYEISGEPKKAFNKWVENTGFAMFFAKGCNSLKEDRMAVRSAGWAIQKKYKLSNPQWQHLGSQGRQYGQQVLKKVQAYMKAKGLTKNSNDKICRLGHRHLAKRTAIGRMLKAR